MKYCHKYPFGGSAGTGGAMGAGGSASRTDIQAQGRQTPTQERHAEESE
jgi:hypothetical protein